jgi:molecular chaperone GrpE
MNEDQNKPENTTDAAPAQPELSEVEILQAEVGKWKNEFLYLKAEFDNYKKNVLKERSELLKYGAERVAKDMLEVADNFERALEVKITPETVNTFKQGVEMTAKELKDSLGKHGIQEVPGLGQPFNPQFFEALSAEATDKFAEGSISRVFKKAYKLHDKIIRMGQVVVATAPKDIN